MYKIQNSPLPRDFWGRQHSLTTKWQDGKKKKKNSVHLLKGAKLTNSWLKEFFQFKIVISFFFMYVTITQKKNGTL